MRAKPNLSVFLLGLAFPWFSCASAFAEEKEISVEEFLQGLSTVPGSVSRKDPFVEAPPPFDVPKDVNGEYSSTIPVMERYPVTDYEVVAVLIGDKYPRALVRLPDKEKQKVVIVKVKDKLGNRKGIITKIVREGVVVQQSVRSKMGFIDKTDVVLRVGGTADKQKAALMATQMREAQKEVQYTQPALPARTEMANPPGAPPQGAMPPGAMPPGATPAGSSQTK